jgi:hypothetical protein
MLTSPKNCICPSSIFDSRIRRYENFDKFNAVLIIPTGIGAELGGHAGDGGSVARLLAANCDTLITHPNVVNASDINELPENGLYVEGSIIDRFLMGMVGLQKVKSNRVILLVEKHEDTLFYEAAINAAAAAHASLGLNIPFVAPINTMRMRSFYTGSGRAAGQINDFEYVTNILHEYKKEFDAVALSSIIKVPWSCHTDYYHNDIINPWGGVEAMLTHAVSLLYNVPSAHAPMLESKEVVNLDLGIVDPRKAAEAVSTTFLHSVLKGLHKSPRIFSGHSFFGKPGVLDVSDVSCLIIPDGCMGLPVLAAIEQGISVIAVKNKNLMRNRLEEFPFATGQLHIVDNYLEAAGMMTALKAGVDVKSVRRPVKNIKVISNA